jgi:hypothetical protein
MEENQEPKNTVLEVQNHRISIGTVIKRIEEGLKEEGKDNGKISP